MALRCQLLKSLRICVLGSATYADGLHGIVGNNTTSFKALICLQKLVKYRNFRCSHKADSAIVVLTVIGDF